MTSYQQGINSALKQMEAFMGSQVFTFKGIDYPCLHGSANEYNMLSDGGFSENLDLIVKIRKELFTDGIFPVEQEKGEFQNKQYRIFKVINEPAGVFVKLVLYSPNKGV